MSLNCTPGQIAWITKPWPTDPCSVKCTGVPVKVSHLHDPQSIGELFDTIVVGPTWVLASALACPHAHRNCSGIGKVPDACLRPFDEESAPTVDDLADQLEDIKVKVDGVVQHG